MIEHCVFMRLKASLPADEKQALFASLAELQSIIPGITGFKSGSNVSPEGLSGGFRDGFVVTFDTAEARDAYLVHANHVAVAERLVAACDGGLAGLMVFDFEV
ncbi:MULTISPECIES: Dabb family protein [unclassified Rhizobium]|uniref:Dabb family protein n=1 Tax=unclassified Rhizobium TaxID=2613769 RepID=UPI003D2ABC3F